MAFSRILLAGAAGISTLVLAGCGAPDSGQDGAEGTVVADGEVLSQDQLAEAASGMLRPEAGQYQTTMELIDVDIPGMPAAQLDMMKNMFETAASSEYCLTQEDADKGYEEMVRGGQKGDCEFQKFDTDGGNIDAAMTCNADGAVSRMTMVGTGTSTSGNMKMTMEQESTEMGTIKMSMNVRHKRIGDCAG